MEEDEGAEEGGARGERGLEVGFVGPSGVGAPVNVDGPVEKDVSKCVCVCVCVRT